MERKTKIKNQKGFIQIPLLIAIIVSVVITSTATTGIILYKQGKLSPMFASVSELFDKSPNEGNLELGDIQETNQEEDANQVAGINKLKEEFEESKKETIPDSPINPVISSAPVVSIPEQKPITQIQPTIESWSELERKYFSEANQKGWTTLIITNALGEKKYYRKEGNQWIEKNSEVEIQKAYVPSPTIAQLTRLRRLCLASPDIASVCAESKFMSGYYSNLTFRILIDELVDKYHAFLSDQEQQKVMAEIKTLDCLMAPTPEDERVLSPATQNYLRQVRCGTVTDADRTNYELSRIKSSVDELKYRLETKTSFPPVLLDTVEPTDWGSRWEIRWDGYGGGTIKDSTGGFYQFRCETNYCVSY